MYSTPVPFEKIKNYLVAETPLFHTARRNPTDINNLHSPLSKCIALASIQ